MRRKFLQITAAAVAAAAALTVSTLAAMPPDFFPPETSPSETLPPETEQPLPGPVGYTGTEGAYSGVGNQLMRIGIYYGSNGKSSVDVTTVTGDGFLLGYYESGSQFVQETSTTSLNLSVEVDPMGDGLVVYDRSSGEVVYAYYGQGEGLGIEPYSLSGEQTVVKCGYPYYGSFRFDRATASAGEMTIVNLVRLDDYIKGVVPYEMSASWPLEALKVQAVCARSYALSHINSSHQRNYNFDLCDTTDCQAYHGVYSGSSADKVVASVEETSGLTLMYNGEYCDAVYSSSNGGASESAVNVWGSDVPYLIGKEDPYEAYLADSIPNYAWSFTFSGEELQQELVDAGYTKCGEIVQVQTTASDTGNVIALTFTDEYGKSYSVYRTQCRTFLSLRSLRYSVSSDGGATDGSLTVNDGETLDPAAGLTVIDGSGAVTTIDGGYVITAGGVEEIGSAAASGTTFTFSGTGWGHNVGMSQYGAYAMAELGYTFQQILEFYYTGATIG